jgi:hypothetical protein
MSRHLLALSFATCTALAVCGCDGFLRDKAGQPTTFGGIVDAAAAGATAGAAAGGPVGAGVGGVAGLLLGLVVAAIKDRQLQALKRETGRTGKTKPKAKTEDVAPELRGDSAPHDICITK